VDLGDGITTGRDEYGFDARGRQIHQARVLGGVPFVIEHDYDNADRPVQSRYPGGQILQRRFDGASRITGFDGLLDAVDYDDRDQLERLEYRNGVVSWYEYDQRQRLSRLTTLGGDDQVLQGFEYRRDRAGNVLAIDDLATRRDGHPDATATFGYDAWYRLIDAELAVAQPSQSAAAAAVEQLGFRYDSIDNVLSATSSLGVASAAHMGEYAYDGGRPNAVARFGGVDQAHDAAGNVVQRGNQTLTWDFAGRLTRVADRSGAAVAHFAYGHDETRVAKKEAGTLTYYIAPEFEVRDGVGVLYAQLGRQRVARLENPGLAIAVLSDVAPLDGGGQGRDGEINAADAWVAHAIVAGIIDGGGAAPSAPMDLLRSSARRLLAELDGGPVFLHADALGSLTLATSSAGAIVGERAFHPFGEVRSEPGYVDNRGFTGQERDDSTGLLHFQYRYLDPGAGRWASPDPMFATASEAGLSHLGEFSGSYGYVANNPANMIDALGLFGSEGFNAWWKDNKSWAQPALVIGGTLVAELAIGCATGGLSLVGQAAVATAVVAVVMGINAFAESRGHRWTDAAIARGDRDVAQAATLRANTLAAERQTELDAAHQQIATLARENERLKTRAVARTRNSPGMTKRKVTFNALRRSPKRPSGTVPGPRKNT
jgi:RHS repeat-associated protein